MNIENLPIEKQFAHQMFCAQIQSIELPDAIKLLEQIHLLYLSQGELAKSMIGHENQEAIAAYNQIRRGMKND